MALGSQISESFLVHNLLSVVQMSGGMEDWNLESNILSVWYPSSV